MSDYSLEEVRDALVETALEAGKLIKAKVGFETFDDKKNSVDLVTEIDKKVELLVQEKLSSRFPTFKFIGEESFDNQQISDDPTFIVDPIDGTTNFIHNFPYSCTSIGFSVNKKPTVGVVYNPHRDLLFTAIKGKGAFLNGEKLPVLTKPLTLQSSLVALEGGSDRSGEIFKVKTDTYFSLLSSEGGFIHGFRSLGSAALNMCFTATGELDAYWEGGCQSWDVCAAWVILQETGGRVVDGNKGRWDIPIDNRVYLCVRGAPEEDQKKYIEDFWSNVKGELKY